MNGQASQPDASGNSPHDVLYKRIGEIADLKLAEVQLNMVGGGGSGNDDFATRVQETAKAFGMDIGKMSERSDALALELQRAQSDATKAEIGLEMQELRHAIEMSAGGGQASPLEELGLRLVERNFDGSAPAKTPMQEAMDLHQVEMLTNAFRNNAVPTDPMEAMQNAFNMFKAFQDMMPAPPPAAIVPTGLSPEHLFTIDMERLKMEERLAEVKLARESNAVEAANTKMITVMEMIVKGFETIGGAVADQFSQQQDESGTGRVARPEKRQEAAAAPANEAHVIACPDCSQAGVHITASQEEAVRAGGKVQVVCTECGANHTYSLDAEEDDPGEELEAEMVAAGAPNVNRDVPSSILTGVAGRQAARDATQERINQMRHGKKP